MHNCFVDITTEFLAVAFHNILYYTSVYPKSIFDRRKKYNIVVNHSIHPEVNQYINLCLKSISECLKTDQLACIEFAVTDNQYNTLLKFVFQFHQNMNFDETGDAYLVQCEQNLRTFCLKLAAISNHFKHLPDDCSFSIYIHTNESNAVAISINPDFEEFPLVEVSDKTEVTQKIIPLTRFSIRNYGLDTFVEMK
ncbi:mitotic spindle assembly checkpoint protein MAD2B [Helicoverpa armigera]|uniref:mitotic spindle assembly checkpoint protein MAD2B n=1 Tax=Helicoverpa armigera TaxID=29058 RepID=UPI003083EC76